MLDFMSSVWGEAMDPYCLKKLNAERRAGQAAILITDLGDGRDRVVRKDNAVAGELGAALTKAFASGRGGIVEIAGRSFFLDVHLPPPADDAAQ